MKQKGLTPMLIVLLVAAVIGGYLIYQNQSAKPTSPIITVASPAPTGAAETVYTEDTRSANWKTYTNTRYGYRVKYPSDVDFTDTKRGEKINSDNIPSLCCIVLSKDPGFYLGIDVSEETKTLEEYKNQFLSDESGEHYKARDIGMTKFMNEDALTYKKITTSFYVIIKNKMRYIVTTITPDDKLMNQILSTFKFTQ